MNNFCIAAPLFVSHHVCNLQLKQVPKVTDIGLKPRPIKKVAIIGGGLMGSGIATAFILSNISVVLKEINNDYLLKGRKMIEGGFFYTGFSSGLRFMVCL